MTFFEYFKAWHQFKAAGGDPLWEEQKASDAMPRDKILDIEDEIMDRDKILVPDVSFTAKENRFASEPVWDIWICAAGLKYILRKEVFCPSRILYQEWE